MDIQKTSNKMMHVSCSGCGIGDVVGESGSMDEMFLEFLARFDQGLVTDGEGQKFEDLGMVRNRGEIEAMIGDSGPDETVREILFSSRYYVAQYMDMAHPEPEMGVGVEDSGLSMQVCAHLKAKGIGRFYRFQEEAIRRIMSGQSIVIEAPTASGKTEAFAVPVIQMAAEAPGGVFAVFVYPTKALARDQIQKIREVAQLIGIGAEVFDGDTAQEARQKIMKKTPAIIVTNFDVLHYHMWKRTRFASLLASARILVVDEAHVYSGIFGSNVHYIVKRFRRICRKGLQVVAASATLENSGEFCRQLFGEEMHVIRGAGRRGGIDFAMLFPSLMPQKSLMVDITKKMTRKNHKTMIFNNSHLNAELLAIQARRQKIDIMVHRAGLMAGYRTAVEGRFRDGSLQAISCTPTLELGIDIGDVDCVVSSVVPVNRLIQRIGRSARKGQRGYAFLVLGNDPISQYYRNHSGDYFEDIERIYVDPANPIIEEFQVLAMACDTPISPDEMGEHREAIERHVMRGNLRVSGGKILPVPARVRQLDQYSIRGIGESVDILLDGRKVGERALPIALGELHKDAIYLLAGTKYRVGEFDAAGRRAKLVRIPADHPYHTRALIEEWPTVKAVFEKRNVYGVEVAFCRLHIKKTVHGYVRVRFGEDVGQGERFSLDEPIEYDFVTKGIVFHAPRPVEAAGTAESPEYVEASGYHATEHVVIEGSNMITGGVSQDLGGIALGVSGLIIVYDGAVGGSGASKTLYDRFEKVLKRGFAIVGECPCKAESGCPRCTFSYRCGNNNEYLHKNSSLEILGRIIGGEETRLTEPVEGERPLV